MFLANLYFVICCMRPLISFIVTKFQGVLKEVVLLADSSGNADSDSSCSGCSNCNKLVELAHHPTTTAQFEESAKENDFARKIYFRLA